MTRWQALGMFGLLGTLAVVHEARADEAGDKQLAAVDTALNRAKTMIVEYDVISLEPGKNEKKLGLKVTSKGKKKLLEFVSPADMKGTKVLILSPTEVYVYLPAFGKVRRIGADAGGEGFLGLTYSVNDWARTAYAPDYTGQVASSTDNEVSLTAALKPGQTSSYAKIDFSLDKARNLPTQLKIFDAKGTNIKTETRTGYSCEGDVCTPAEQTMVDNAKDGHSTRLRRKKIRVNEPVSDDLFSKRNLEK